jgi:hypothetical protein
MAHTSKQFVSRRVGALVGVAAATPFAAFIALVSASSYVEFAAAIALACMSAGALTGATIGRSAARDPSVSRAAGAAAFAVLVGAPIATIAYLQLHNSPEGTIFWMIPGIVMYGLPVFLILALPAVTLGIFIARHVAALSP